jgi:hypothetical protein
MRYYKYILCNQKLVYLAMTSLSMFNVFVVCLQAAREPEVRAVAEPVEPTTPESPKTPVYVAGIEFSASAEEARRRISGRRKDVRASANLSAKEKYDLFQRL